MHGILLLAVVFLSTFAAFAQHEHGAVSQRTIVLSESMGDLHHPVSTKSAEAQRYFNQGLTFVYAFNHDAAIRSFQRAAELDPLLAMAHWGVALALGPNINLDVDPEREMAAFEAVQRAKELSAGASEPEQDYINSLAKRYSIAADADLKELAAEYSVSMRDLTRKYPDDLDAAVLFAESAMNLKPWALWSNDGKAAEGTEEIIRVLEGVLKRDPAHIGANHYYIHAVEASPWPEKALPSAERLKTLVPSAGHLVHMPSHIYIRTGDYAAAARSNQLAAQADRALFEKDGAEGFYPLMYYNHNLHFLAAAHAMDGNYAEASKAAEELGRNLGAVIEQMPMLDGLPATSDLIRVRFRKWNETLEATDPPGGPVSKSLRHYARGMALSASGKQEDAELELKSLKIAASTLTPDTLYMLNKAADVVSIAEALLEASIARQKEDLKRAIELLEQSVAAQDSLNYNEPPDWLFPIRETLGGTLAVAGRYVEAERVFREDLDRNPRNPRSLFGLSVVLRKQGKTPAAESVEREYRKGWQRADISLTIEDL